jgi:hypothetical protein
MWIGGWWLGVQESRRVPKIGVLTHVRPKGPAVLAEHSSVALYVELTDHIIPTARPHRHGGPGRPPAVTDAELVCLAVAQVLLRYHHKHHWLRAAPPGSGTCSPGCCRSPNTTGGCASWPGCWRPRCTGWPPTPPASAELLRLVDGTPVVCGRSRTTAMRSALAGWAGYGRDPSHHCFYWGARLLLCTPEGTLTGFGLANHRLVGERQAVVGLLGGVVANRPAPGTLLVGDKGLAGRDVQAFLERLGLSLVRPARADEPDPGVFPNWLRQRIEAIIWTLKHQLGLDRPGGRIPAGLWARVVQRLLALNAAIWFNWQIGAPVKRSLAAYDH